MQAEIQGGVVKRAKLPAASASVSTADGLLEMLSRPCAVARAERLMERHGLILADAVRMGSQVDTTVGRPAQNS